MKKCILVFAVLFCSAGIVHGALDTRFDSGLSPTAAQSGNTTAKNSKAIGIKGNFSKDKSRTASLPQQISHSDSLADNWKPWPKYLLDLFSMPVITEQDNQSPEPATMLLFGTGMAGLVFITRRKFRKE